MFERVEWVKCLYGSSRQFEGTKAEKTELRVCTNDREWKGPRWQRKDGFECTQRLECLYGSSGQFEGAKAEKTKLRVCTNDREWKGPRWQRKDGFECTQRLECLYGSSGQFEGTKAERTEFGRRMAVPDVLGEAALFRSLFAFSQSLHCLRLYRLATSDLPVASFASQHASSRAGRITPMLHVLALLSASVCLAAPQIPLGLRAPIAQKLATFGDELLKEWRLPGAALVLVDIKHGPTFINLGQAGRDKPVTEGERERISRMQC
jgi:hypothetical protein